MTEGRTNLNSALPQDVLILHKYVEGVCILWLLNHNCLLQLLGIKAADAKELKLIASQPSLKHVFNVANFDGIVDIQNEIILQVCSGVDEQLGELVSGEEGETL